MIRSADDFDTIRTKMAELAAAHADVFAAVDEDACPGHEFDMKGSSRCIHCNMNYVDLKNTEVKGDENG